MNSRQNRKRLRKLIRGGFQISKYASYSTVMLSLGCVVMDNWISVSEDGRYVAVQLLPDTKEVVANVAQNESMHSSDFYIIDLLTKKAKFIGTSDNAWGWLSNTKNDIVFVSDFDNDASISIINQKSQLTIPNVSYPCISGNGKWVAYSEIDKENGLNGVLYIKKLPDGKPKKIANNAILADFSPNSKYLSFLIVDENENEEQQFNLVISKIDGTEQKTLDTISDEVYDEVILFPHWINNNQVIYKNINEQSGEDGEVFLVDRSGKITQVTHNEDEEFFFQASKKGVFYGILNTEAKGDDIPMFDLNYSKKVKDKWVQQKLGLSPFYYKIAKDKIVYITFGEEQDSEYQSSVHMASLDDLIKGKELSPINLTEIIRKNDIKK